MKPILPVGELMTPHERFHALLNGTPMDRVPIDLFMSNIKAKFLGIALPKYWLSEDHLVLGEVLAFNKFGMDFVGIGPNFHAVAEAMGATLSYPSDAPVTVCRPAVRCIEEIDLLSPASMTDHLQMFYHATARLRELFDRLCPLVVSLPGPMTLAALLLGTETFLQDLQEKSAETKRLIDFVIGGLQNIIDPFSSLDVLFSIADPVACTNLISESSYQKYALPATLTLCRYILSRSAYAPSYHVCGNTKELWPMIRQLPIGLFSLDNTMNLSDACDFFSDSAIIAGNVDAVRILCQGNAKEINQAVRNALHAGTHCSKGFVLAPGCDLPIATPEENIRRFVQSGKSCSSRNISFH